LNAAYAPKADVVLQGGRTLMRSPIAERLGCALEDGKPTSVPNVLAQAHCPCSMAYEENGL